MKAIRFGLAVAATSLMLGAPVQAATTPVRLFDVKLSSAKPNGPTTMSMGFRHHMPDDSALVAGTDIWIALAPGLAINADAFPECNYAELQNTNYCPRKTLVGEGFADAVVNVGGLGTVRAELDIYVGTPERSGDAASFYINANEPQTGTQFILTGYVNKNSRGLWQFEIRNFRTPPVLGIYPIINNYFMKLGAKQVVATKVRGKKRRRNGKRRTRTVKRTVSLFTTPRSCNGKWKFNAIDYFENGTQTSVDALADCKKR